ncbi:MAG: hypothetical protein ABSE36_04035 [Terracidiphilus sp.]|jgi:hypothetical protein
MSTAYPQVGGYPAPQYAPPAYRLHDWISVAVATFFGGPLAGTVLMASNYRKLGQGNEGVLALVLGAAASVGLIYMALKTTMNPWVATLVLLVCTSAAAYQLQGDAIKTHVAWGGQLYSKLRAFGVAIATALVLGCALIGYLVYTGQWQSFGARYGVGPTAVTIGTKDQVIYSGTATQADATALGNALKAAGYFQDRGVNVLLSKGTSGTTIGFVVQDGYWNNPGIMSQFEEVVRGVASTVGGLPIQVQLLNNTKVVEKSGTVGEVDFSGGDAVIYEGTATQADAQALGNQFTTIGFFEGKGANVFLTKDNGTTIAFVVSDGTWNNATMVSDFETIVRGVASTVGGLPIEMHLVNTTLVVEKDEPIQ